MYFADLQSFLAHLDKHDNLATVKVAVDPYLEIAAIVDRVCKSPGNTRALLFEHVKGYKLPLAANLFGSQQRVALALGFADIEERACRLRNDLRAYNGVAAGQALAQLTATCASEIISPRTAPCFKKDVSKSGLDGFPALHSWPGDGGRYLTLGQVFTRHPGSGRLNCGMYRVQILDKHTALLRCHSGSGGGAHMAAWHEQGKAMPLAIALGGPPALTWCAGTSLPDEVSELEFLSYLNGQAISVSQCQNSDLQVPTCSEIVIEGYIKPGEEKTEGPFGNHTGYYTPAAPAPMIRITSVFTRESAVYPCTVVGPPPMENMYLAQAAERLMLPLLQHDHPWIIDIHMPLQGIYHRAALVSVDAPQISMQDLGKALRQTLLLRNSRLIVLLDKDTDLREFSKIYWRLVNADSWVKSVLIDSEKMTIDARSVSQAEKVRPEQAMLNQVIKRWQEFSLDV